MQLCSPLKHGGQYIGHGCLLYELRTTMAELDERVHVFTQGPPADVSRQIDQTTRYSVIQLENGVGLHSISPDVLVETGRASSFNSLSPVGVRFEGIVHNGVGIKSASVSSGMEGNITPAPCHARTVLHGGESHQMTHAVVLPMNSGLTPEPTNHIFHKVSAEEYAQGVAVASWPDGHIGGIEEDGTLNRHSEATALDEDHVSFPLNSTTKVGHVVRINANNKDFMGGNKIKQVQVPGANAGAPLVVMKKDDLKKVTAIVKEKVQCTNPLAKGCTIMIHNNDALGDSTPPDNHHAIVKWRLLMPPRPDDVELHEAVTPVQLKAVAGATMPGQVAQDATQALTYKKLSAIDQKAEVLKAAGIALKK